MLHAMMHPADALARDVSDFHAASGQGRATEPAWPSAYVIAMRLRLLAEEHREVIDAVADGDLVELADGLLDMLYVLIGTALEFGVPLGPCWLEVHASNMAKVGPDGQLRRRSDGKVLKPDGWRPPDVRRVLREHGMPERIAMPEPTREQLQELLADPLARAEELRELAVHLAETRKLELEAMERRALAAERRAAELEELLAASA